MCVIRNTCVPPLFGVKVVSVGNDKSRSLTEEENGVDNTTRTICSPVRSAGEQ